MNSTSIIYRNVGGIALAYATLVGGVVHYTQKQLESLKTL